MKLALIIDDYLPDSTRVGAKMFHELAQEFIQRGHDVTVIYPDSSLQEKILFDSFQGVKTWR
ncbi:glycosyltransferase family 4 protein, partial [Salmonella enterica subsp. diarizonae]|nr:glycosyltransferase family 4 protein [Salmonella enterica subsp. diarizonae]